ncbi:MAG: hypothetical protein LBJ95_00895 [Oscillospiraceae bacterium]|jgi:hypothetical protein|nr:hypothetical protein [Oscillospiraceae bacterium]
MSKKDLSQLQDERLSSTSGGFKFTNDNGTTNIYPTKAGKIVVINLPGGMIPAPPGSPNAPARELFSSRFISVDFGIGQGLQWVAIDEHGRPIPNTGPMDLLPVPPGGSSYSLKQS